ncbi:MAG TPA: DNA polymerase III subunit gamma and tau [Pseudolysinimonas sp.]|nr:DNA polymerase III subunit gamma and tau [Pseudolysinimonas sp.]
MVTALYRRYRPQTFAELIGQTQVTDPLRTALRTDRVNHAYLFSGPRGCGKTTSARILARCLNCAEGPTDTPCGVCPSCVELARDGGGSLDVVEIDAASHNGVDDARDLRERAAFAPARDRYKIFILDEAHMVTPQGFNALLKLVEEPPEHIKFIFATTEPEKVIGTIRSRTHHYPFRLVPPAQMLDYVAQLSASEGVEVQPGVLPLVVRAGGGSVRDTLSLLDQLIAGSDPSPGSGNVVVAYERAVALLGYTHGALLDEVVDAIGATDAGAAFGAVDRVIQTGQDPRRFVEDLLERLRDLIVVAATRDRAASVLRGIPQDELDHMAAQSAAFGAAELSRAADVVNTSLTEMTGATSPRLHLELMVARLLVPASDSSSRGALARVERLERRIGIADGSAPPAPVVPVAPVEPVETRTPTPVVEPVETTPPSVEPAPAVEPVETPLPTPEASTGSTSGVPAAATSTPVTAQQLRDAWPEILEVVKKTRRNSWMVVYTTTVRDFADDVLTLSFASDNDIAGFRPTPGSKDSVSEHLRAAIQQVLGIRVKFLPKVDAARPLPADEAPQASSDADLGWTVAAIPGDVSLPSDDEAPPPDPAPPVEPVEATTSPVEPGETPSPSPASPRATAPAPKTPAPRPTPRATVGGKERYGEAVVREILGAQFIEEQSLAPRDSPVTLDPSVSPEA